MTKPRQILIDESERVEILVSGSNPKGFAMAGSQIQEALSSYADLAFEKAKSISDKMAGSHSFETE